MEMRKSYYKSLPKHNGYTWAYYDAPTNRHVFTKQLDGYMHNGSYSVLSLSDKNIECAKSFKFMLKNELSEVL